MTKQERRECLRLLERAQAGDDLAFEPLVRRISHHFRFMLMGYDSVDPAFDRDDLHSHFQEGIWRAISKVDHRGDPLFHLAERGRWEVASLLAAIKQRRHGTAKWIEEHGRERSIGCIPEGFDVPDHSEESNPQFVVEAREDREGAKRRVTRVLANVQITGRDRQVLDWMVQDEDPGELGANQRLARRLGVTEQRASQLRKRVVRRLTAEL